MCKPEKRWMTTKATIRYLLRVTMYWLEDKVWLAINLRECLISFIVRKERQPMWRT